jgi:ATP-dependent RNA helicase DeaD
VPHSSFATWEPTAEKDDDRPIFEEGRGDARVEGAQPVRAPLPEPPPLPRTTEGSAQPRALDDGIQLFVNVGRRDGARASDLQAMLESAGFAKEDIGQIRVRDRNSFVSLRKDAADRGIAAFTGKTVGSRGVIAELARPRSGEA